MRSLPGNWTVTASGSPGTRRPLRAGTGRIVTYKQAIWPDSPEKVLGVTRKWAQSSPETLAGPDARHVTRSRLVRRSCERREHLTGLLAGPDYLSCSPDLCRPALERRCALRCDNIGCTSRLPEVFRRTGGSSVTPPRKMVLRPDGQVGAGGIFRFLARLMFCTSSRPRSTGTPCSWTRCRRKKRSGFLTVHRHDRRAWIASVACAFGCVRCTKNCHLPPFSANNSCTGAVMQF